VKRDDVAHLSRRFDRHARPGLFGDLRHQGPDLALDQLLPALFRKRQECDLVQLRNDSLELAALGSGRDGDGSVLAEFLSEPLAEFLGFVAKLIFRSFSVSISANSSACLMCSASRRSAISRLGLNNFF
jgi:hypothetical protein